MPVQKTVLVCLPVHWDGWTGVWLTHCIDSRPYTCIYRRPVLNTRPDVNFMSVTDNRFFIKRRYLTDTSKTSVFHSYDYFFEYMYSVLLSLCHQSAASLMYHAQYTISDFLLSQTPLNPVSSTKPGNNRTQNLVWPNLGLDLLLTKNCGESCFH